MNEFFPLASAAGMTVGLAVCALIIGLALAMFFAVWESVKWRPIAWIGSALVTILRGLPEIPGIIKDGDFFPSGDAADVASRPARAG